MSKFPPALDWVLWTDSYGAHLTDEETEAIPATSISAPTEPLAE